MKKALPLILLCALLLSACSSSGTHGVSGKVVELNTGPEGLESFVMDSSGELLGVTLTDRTYVKSWLDALSAEAFLSGSAPDVALTVYFDGPKSSLVTGSGEEVKAQEAEAVYLTGFLKPEAAVLADGTELGVWQYERATAYAAKDGTELLEPEQRAEIEAAFEPECLTIFENRLELSFDRGVLPSCETGYTLVLDLDEDVLPLLQPWAVPDTKNTP